MKKLAAVLALLCALVCIFSACQKKDSFEPLTMSFYREDKFQDHSLDLVIDCQDKSNECFKFSFDRMYAYYFNTLVATVNEVAGREGDIYETIYYDYIMGQINYAKDMNVQSPDSRAIMALYTRVEMTHNAINKYNVLKTEENLKAVISNIKKSYEVYREYFPLTETGEN